MNRREFLGGADRTEWERSSSGRNAADGIVKEIADAITRPHGTQLARARESDGWIVENTVRSTGRVQRPARRQAAGIDR
jgi:hypothetical protein